jgi:hypothetical protein
MPSNRLGAHWQAGVDSRRCTTIKTVSPEYAAELLENLEQILEDANQQERKQLYSQLFRKIYVSEGK